MDKFVLRNTIIDILIRIERDSGYSHLLIDHEIKSRRISKKDEALLTEIVYGTVQRKLTLDYYINHFVNKNKKLQPWVKMLLRMSIYQMFFLDKVPDHAIIHEAVEIAKQRGHKGIGSFVNGVLRNMRRNGLPDTALIEDDVERLAIETSHPKWLIKRWLNCYGYQLTKEMCNENLTHKPISVRVQPLRINRDEAIERLTAEGFTVTPSEFSSQGIIVREGNILKSSLFTEGLLTIQDQSSMLVAEMLQVSPGMTVLDTCSAPGGKATHIAEKMGNQGIVKAYDLHKKKLNLISEKAASLKITIIDINEGDARNLHKLHQPESFDRILVDAPCSGLGVIRGKPDIKYNKLEKDIYQLAKVQFDILSSIAPLLKPNGYLIYSTCTVDPHENEEVVKKFLAHYPEYELDTTFIDDLPLAIKKSPGVSDYGLQLFPQTYHTDGFFLSRLKKVK